MKRTVFMLALALVLEIAVAIAGGQILHAQQAPDPRVADLVRAGKLRVGIGVVAPHWAIKDPATGELRGVAVEVARALAARLGVELVVVEYRSPPMVSDGLKDGAWDVGFLGVDASRAKVVDFAPPHMQVDASYLVAADSSVRSIADADRTGVRIAVARNSVEDIVLSRTLKLAELRRAETSAAGFDLLRAGNADALANPVPSLFTFSAQLPGSRVLEDRFYATFGAMAVPKGQAGRLAYISEFVEEAKASGLVQRAIERAGVRGVRVAPPGHPSAQ